MALRFPIPYAEWMDGDGAPLAGGKLYFYATGTSTPQATYSDSTLTTPNANPVVANADGWWPAIFLQGLTYKVVLKDANDVQIWSADPVYGAGGGGGPVSTSIRIVTVSGNVTANDGTVEVNSALATTQTLPAAATVTGSQFTVKNINTGTVTVAGTIDGATNYSIPAQNQSVTFQSNGTSYIVI